VNFVGPLRKESSPLLVTIFVVKRTMRGGKVLGFHQVEQPNTLGGKELLDEDRA
jgi:hypothetical protein